MWPLVLIGAAFGLWWISSDTDPRPVEPERRPPQPRPGVDEPFPSTPPSKPE